MAAKREAIANPGALKAARLRAGFTQPQASTRTGLAGNWLSDSTIANLERGAKQPSKAALVVLSAIYDCEVEELGHVLAPDEAVCSNCRGHGTVPTLVGASS